MPDHHIGSVVMILNKGSRTKETVGTNVGKTNPNKKCEFTVTRTKRYPSIDD